MTWTLMLALSWLVVLVYCRAPRVRTFAPLLFTTALSAVLVSAWLGERVRPWAQRVLQSHFHSPDPSLATRLATLVFDGAALGRSNALAVPWLVLAALFVTGIVVSRSERRVFERRARRLRLGSSLSGRARLQLWLRRAVPVGIVVACLIGYLVVPLWIDGVLLVYPRFLLFAAVFSPLVFGARVHAVRCLALGALVPGLWLVGAARAEVAFNASRTACFDRLLPELRSGEALLELPFYFAAPGYVLPIDLHLAAEAIARHGGYAGFEFADLNSPVVYRERVDRLIAPPSLVWRAKLYHHAVQGREFTAWLAMGSQRELDRLLPVFAGANYRVTRCGAYALVIDSAVPPGSHPHEVFLPHATGHGADGCHMGMHGPASLEPSALFEGPEPDL